MRAIALAASLLLAWPSGPALAQSPDDRAAARDLARKAEEKAAEGQLAEAQALFEKADALVPAPTLKLAVVRLLISQGKLVEAQVLAQDVARGQPAPSEPATWPRARAEAHELAKSLEPRLAVLELQIAGLPAGVTPAVVLSGQPLPAAAVGVPRVLNPGEHSILISAPGFQAADERVSLAEGQRLKLSVRLHPAEKKAEKALPPPAEPAPRPPPAPRPRERRAHQGLLWGGLAVAGGFGVVGIGAAVVAKQKKDDLIEKCPGESCPDAAERRDQINLLDRVTLGTALVAGAGLAVAVVGLVVGEDDETASAVQPRVRLGLGQASFSWRF